MLIHLPFWTQSPHWMLCLSLLVSNHSPKQVLSNMFYIVQSLLLDLVCARWPSSSCIIVCFWAGGAAWSYCLARTDHRSTCLCGKFICSIRLLFGMSVIDSSVVFVWLWFDTVWLEQRASWVGSIGRILVPLGSLFGLDFHSGSAFSFIALLEWYMSRFYEHTIFFLRTITLLVNVFFYICRLSQS